MMGLNPQFSFMESESTTGDVEVEGYICPKMEEKVQQLNQESHFPTLFNVTKAPFRANLTKFYNSHHKYSWEPVSSSILVFGAASVHVNLEGSDLSQILLRIYTLRYKINSMSGLQQIKQH